MVLHGGAVTQTKEVAMRTIKGNRHTFRVQFDPRDYVVIHDSHFMWPALRRDIEAAGYTRDDVASFDSADVEAEDTEYAEFCRLVPCAFDGLVGSDECIDFCEALIANGAEEWYERSAVPHYSSHL
jgi:hypothetical protein